MSAKMTQQVKLATYKNLQMKRRNKDKTISEILCTSRHQAHSSRRRRLLPTRLNARLVAHAALAAAHTHTRAAGDCAAPIYYVGILCLMQSIIPPIDIPAVREFQPESLEDTLPRLREMTLLFCPDTDEARGVMDRLRSWDHGRPGPRPHVHGFATEADMVEYNHQLALSGGPNASAATTSKDASADGLGPMAQVVGLSFTSLTRGTVSYTIRMQQEAAPQLDRWKTPAQGGAEANESRCETLSFFLFLSRFPL
jgi:hypothetical protein